MKVWLSYSTLCCSLRAAEKGDVVLLPDVDDLLFFGCHEACIGSCPYGGHASGTSPSFSPEVLHRAANMYSFFKERGRAVCVGDIRNDVSNTEETVWYTLALSLGDVSLEHHFMEELDRLFEDRTRGQSYCYPTAVDVLEKIGIMGIMHVVKV